MVIRIGLIGVGGLGFLQAQTFNETEDVSIIAAVDVAEQARQIFEQEFASPAYEHHRELLHNHGTELDAVTIVTPHTLHYEQAMDCIERGIHVLIEKPMVTQIDQAVDLIEMAADRGVVLQVGYQRHFHPGFREVRRIIQSGRIGTIHMVSIYLGQDWVDLHSDTWRMDPSLSGGGQLYDTGSHVLDALLWTTGTRPVSVGAQISVEKSRVDINSALSLQLEESDTQITASVGISGDGVDVDPTEGYVYWGTDGRLDYTNGRLTVAEKEGMTYQTEITEGIDFQTLNKRKLENFISSMQGTVDPAVPGEFGLQVTALTEAAYQAAETGSVISVQSLIETAYADRDGS